MGMDIFVMVQARNLLLNVKDSKIFLSGKRIIAKTDNNNWVLGDYETIEKSIDVFKMLFEAITVAKAEATHVTFQMPRN